MLAEIGSFRFHELASFLETPILPPFITSVCVRNVRMANQPLLLGPAVGVRYHEVPHLLGEGLRNLPLRTSLCGFDQTIVLVGAVRDGPLERVWTASFEGRFWECIRSLAPVVCVSPDYSSYDQHEQCRNTQLLNMKRSLRFCLEARDNGIPCALSISWTHERDIQRWGEYLAGPGSSIDCVSINVQTSASHAEVMSSRIPEIEEAAGRKLRWLVNGPAAWQTFVKVLRHVPYDRLSFLSANAHMKAIYGRIGKERFPGPRDVNVLLTLNHEHSVQALNSAMWGQKHPTRPKLTELVKESSPSGTGTLDLVLPF